MNLSVSTWNYQCERKEEADLDRAVGEIVEDGFGVELWLGWLADPGIVERPRWDHLKELVEGAPAVSLHTRLGQYDEEAMKGEIAMCAHLGGRIVVVHSGTIGAKEDRTDFSHIRELARYAQGKGVILALENGPLALLRRVVDEVDLFSADGGLGICIDVGHANIRRYGYSVEQYLDEFRERLVHLHLADNFKEKDDHLTPGEGTIPWKSVVSRLREFDFRRFGALEINSTQARSNAEKGRAFLEALAREIGWE